MSGGIPGYDKWKLATPPEYAEQGEPPVEENEDEPGELAIERLLNERTRLRREILELKKATEDRDYELELAQRQPRVGVAVIVTQHSTGKILMGVRGEKCSHGVGTWALPGGHLEYFEDIWNCARREVLEETGIKLDPDAMMFADEFANLLYEKENRHYLTIFVRAIAPQGAEPRVMEPGKCDGWQWVDRRNTPEPRFAALEWLVEKGKL